MARREKKPVHKVVMTEGKRNIIQQLLQEYDIETAEDIQDALKDLLGGTIKEMMEAEWIKLSPTFRTADPIFLPIRKMAAAVFLIISVKMRSARLQ